MDRILQEGTLSRHKELHYVTETAKKTKDNRSCKKVPKGPHQHKCIVIKFSRRQTPEKWSSSADLCSLVAANSVRVLRNIARLRTQVNSVKEVHTAVAQGKVV
jgi:hypothetical protein